MKDLKRALAANELENIEAKKPPKIRHFKFEGMQGESYETEDIISIPICGDMKSNPMATDKVVNVTCHDCLERLKAIALLDSYAAALKYVKTYAPVLFEPDKKIIHMKDQSGEPASVVAKHMRAKRLLDSRALQSPADVPANMIGSRKETLYKSLMRSRIVYTEDDSFDIDGEVIADVVVGDSNPDTMKKIDELLTIFA